MTGNERRSNPHFNMRFGLLFIFHRGNPEIPLLKSKIKKNEGSVWTDHVITEDPIWSMFPTFSACDNKIRSIVSGLQPRLALGASSM